MKYGNLTLGQIEAIVNKLGGIEGVQKFLSGELIVVLKDRIVYNLTVDYTKPLMEMIKAGKYDQVNSDITQENFPVVGSGKKEKELVLFQFNRRILSDDAIDEMSKAGCDPGDIVDLLALGEDQPELQRQFPIVALKSSWRHPAGSLRVPYLCGRADDRDLNLYYFENDWNEGGRFLGRRK